MRSLPPLGSVPELGSRHPDLRRRSLESGGPLTGERVSPVSGRTAWVRNLEAPLRDFLRTETGGWAFLLGAAVAALLWVNMTRPRTSSSGGPGCRSTSAARPFRWSEGELGRARPGNGALSSVQAKYLIFAAAMAPTPELQDLMRGQVATDKQAMAPWATRHMVLNPAGTPTPIDAFWPAGAFKRLRALKATVDPDNLNRANHTIPPAR
jgi:hypothetical protein